MLDFFFCLLRDVMFFAGFVSNGSSFPEPMTSDEERECLKRLANGDQEARTELIERNLRLVAHIAKKYTSPKREQDDLISIGTIGLIKAVATFNPSKNSTLATYSSRCIENEILMALRSEKKKSYEVSLSEPIGSDHDGNEISLTDILGSDPDKVEYDVAARLDAAKLREAVAKQLNERERTVIELRYGLCGGECYTQREVAVFLGISRSYISRIEKKAIEKLSETFYNEDYK